MIVRNVTGTGAFDRWADLRRDVYLDSGFIGQHDLVDGRYVDPYDSRSQHVLVTSAEDDSPLGCARLIHRQGQRLQVEEQFGVDAPDSTAEISGFAVSPGHRGSRVTLVLVRALVDLCLASQTEWVYAEVEPGFLDALRRIGLPMVPLTDQKFVYNTWNLVARASISSFVGGVHARHESGEGGPFDAFFVERTTWHTAGADLVGSGGENVGNVAAG